MTIDKTKYDLIEWGDVRDGDLCGPLGTEFGVIDGDIVSFPLGYRINAKSCLKLGCEFLRHQSPLEEICYIGEDRDKAIIIWPCDQRWKFGTRVKVTEIL